MYLNHKNIFLHISFLITNQPLKNHAPKDAVVKSPTTTPQCTLPIHKNKSFTNFVVNQREEKPLLPEHNISL